jgi:hypothetical protein
MSKAKENIVRFAARPIDPDALVEKVTNQGIDEYFVRAALWSLLDRGRIQETPNRQLVAWA